MTKRFVGFLAAALLHLTTCASAADGTAGEAEILELPFAVKAMRGPGTEVSLAVSTSGLLPNKRPKPSSADPKAAPAREPEETEIAPVAVVWGDEGGAVISLEGDEIKTTLIGAETVEGLVATESPRGAVSGSRRALSGALSAYLSGPVTSGSGRSAGLTLRERQPLGTTSEPKPVPIATTTLAPGNGRVFAARQPRIAAFGGKPAVLAVTAASGENSALVLAAKDAAGTWSITSRTPAQAGAVPLALCGVADFDGSGRPQVATIRDPDAAGVLQLWSHENAGFNLVAENAGYAGASADIDLAAVIPPEPGELPELALPAADRQTLAIVSLNGGIKELARVLLPGTASLGVAVIGRGTRARVLVGLGDGKVAMVAPNAQTSVPP